MNLHFHKPPLGTFVKIVNESKIKRARDRRNSERERGESMKVLCYYELFSRFIEMLAKKAITSHEMLNERGRKMRKIH
jgi:hypothetical protein